MARDCIFCKLASGDIPTEIVLDRGRVVAFRDTNPQAPTHILLIPRDHIADVGELGPTDGDLLAEMVTAANELARAEGIADGGYRLVLNRGPDAGQTVFHLHLHLLGGRVMGWPPG